MKKNYIFCDNEKGITVGVARVRKPSQFVSQDHPIEHSTGQDVPTYK